MYDSPGSNLSPRITTFDGKSNQHNNGLPRVDIPLSPYIASLTDAYGFWPSHWLTVFDWSSVIDWHVQVLIVARLKQRGDQCIDDRRGVDLFCIWYRTPFRRSVLYNKRQRRNSYTEHYRYFHCFALRNGARPSLWQTLKCHHLNFSYPEINVFEGFSIRCM